MVCKNQIIKVNWDCNLRDFQKFSISTFRLKRIINSTNNLKIYIPKQKIIFLTNFWTFLNLQNILKFLICDSEKFVEKVHLRLVATNLDVRLS